ncbi:NTP transferase domain-containing protein [Bacillus gobiensis]|uniref:NTP transferase domain-containing protein n=1 Tax=Bacillus gobiensis TaxID=1441095 RepID=UPI003D1ADC96
MKAMIGIYLAAGKSTRMGRNKLALPLSGTTLGSLSLKAAIQSKLDQVIVIENSSTPHAAWVDPSLLNNQEKWSVECCDDADRGQSYSIVCGVKKAAEMGADGIIIMLADQPFLSVSLINRLLSTYSSRTKPLPYVASKLKNDIRPPILFSKECFPFLLKLKGDEGAKKLILNGCLGEGLSIAHEDPMNFFDIDTPRDYQKAKGEASH